MDFSYQNRDLSGPVLGANATASFTSNLQCRFLIGIIPVLSASGALFHKHKTHDQTSNLQTPSRTLLTCAPCALLPTHCPLHTAPRALLPVGCSLPTAACPRLSAPCTLLTHCLHVLCQKHSSQTHDLDNIESRKAKTFPSQGLATRDLNFFPPSSKV